jgi:hypothetical protein
LNGLGRKGRSRGSGGIWQQWLLAMLASGILVASCSRGPGKTPTPTPTRAPTPAQTPLSTQTPTPTPAQTPAPTPSPTAGPTPAQDPDAEVRDYLARVLPPGPGRDDVFMLCTSCHGITVIILAGPAMDRASWESTRYRHDMGMVGWLRVPWEGREESQDVLWEYLIANLGPDKPPPPPLPANLGGAWRMY